MDHIFEKNMTNVKHRRHGVHMPPELRRPRKFRVIVPTILAMALYLGAPLAHSTQEPFQMANNKTVSAGITSGLVESKIEDIEERIKVSEAAENEQTAQQLGVSLFDLQERTAELREIKVIYQRLLTAKKNTRLWIKKNLFYTTEGKGRNRLDFPRSHHIL